MPTAPRTEGARAIEMRNQARHSVNKCCSKKEYRNAKLISDHCHQQQKTHHHHPPPKKRQHQQQFIIDSFPRPRRVAVQHVHGGAASGPALGAARRPACRRRASRGSTNGRSCRAPLHVKEGPKLWLDTVVSGLSGGGESDCCLLRTRRNPGERRPPRAPGAGVHGGNGTSRGVARAPLAFSVLTYPLSFSGYYLFCSPLVNCDWCETQPLQGRILGAECSGFAFCGKRPAQVRTGLLVGLDGPVRTPGTLR